MGAICIGNCFTKLWSTKFVQQNFFLTSYSFTKVWIPQSYFYLIIRFLSPYQNSYFTKLQVTLQFLWQAAYTQYKQYSQVMYARFEFGNSIQSHNTSMFYFLIRSENINFCYPNSAQKLPTPLRLPTTPNCCAVIFEE